MPTADDVRRDARADYMRRYRAEHPEYDRAYHLAAERAATWVRHNRPDIWRELLDEAQAERGHP